MEDEKEIEKIAFDAYEKLDLIRSFSMLILGFMKQEKYNLDEINLDIIFAEINDKCWKISENVEKMLDKLTSNP